MKFATAPAPISGQTHAGLPLAPSMTAVSQPFTDRARQRLVSIRTAVGARISAARSAFTERYAFETIAPTKSMETVSRTVVQCGFLFPLSGAAPIPLCEGNLVIAPTTTGGVMLRFPLAGEIAPAWLRIERDFAELVDPTESPSPQRFHTNDIISMGTGKYLLKIVHANCRLSRLLEVDAEGVLR